MQTGPRGGGSYRPTNCMRFSGNRSQTLHSMTSSAITKSGSSSRLSHRALNNTNNSDDIVEISADGDKGVGCVASTIVPNTSSQNAEEDERTIDIFDENLKKVGLNNQEPAGDNSSVSSNSISNLNVISSINLDSDFIEAVIEQFKTRSF